MTARAIYPNAQIRPHGALRAEQLEHLCREHGLRLMQTSRGYLYLSPESSTASSAANVVPLPVATGTEGAAAGHNEPEAA